MYDLLGWYFHDYRLSWLAVLYKHHVRFSNGLNGVDLRAFWCSIAPDGLLILSHLRHAILMCHEYMAVAHQHCIADFTTLQLVFITPADLSVLYDKHPSLFTLSGIEEIVPF